MGASSNENHYRVQKVRSKRAILRDKLDPDEVFQVVADCQTFREAHLYYMGCSSGMEMDREIILIDYDGLKLDTIVTSAI